MSAYFRDAREVSEKISGEDLVVGDWDKVAQLYGDAWAPTDRIFDFVTEGVYYGGGATDRLRDSVSETEGRGGHVYFLGLLDQSEAQWNAFIGPRCGVPMSDLETYREHSHVVAAYQNGSDTVSLRELDAPLQKLNGDHRDGPENRRIAAIFHRRSFFRLVFWVGIVPYFIFCGPARSCVSQ